jgi:hypothetical protein
MVLLNARSAPLSIASHFLYAVDCALFKKLMNAKIKAVPVQDVEADETPAIAIPEAL